MLTKYNLENIKKIKEVLLKQEAENVLLTERQHDVLASMVRFHEMVAYMPERLLLDDGTPLFAISSLEDVGLEPGTEVVEIYRQFMEEKPHKVELGSNAYMGLRVQLHVKMMEYLKNLDAKFQTNYAFAATYGEVDVTTGTFVEERSKATEKYAIIKATNSNITPEQHDFLAQMALTRYDLHVHADEFLFSNSSILQDRVEAFVDANIYEKIGLGNGIKIIESVNDLIEEKQIILQLVEKDALTRDAIDSFADKRADVLLQMELFLGAVDLEYKTTYAPSGKFSNYEGLTDEQREQIKNTINELQVYSVLFERGGQTIIDEVHALSKKDVEKTITDDVSIVSIDRVASESVFKDINEKLLEERKVSSEEKSDRERKMDEIKAKLDAGFKACKSSENFIEYLTTMTKFHNYSPNNCMLIHSQMPEASRVASFKKWNELERHVKKGERALQIIAPRQGYGWAREVVVDENGNPRRDTNGEVITQNVKREYTYFAAVPVFDVAQTVGKPLPEICHELNFEVDGYEKLVEALISIAPVSVMFEKITSGAKGYYSSSEQKIVVNADMGEAQTVKTLIHEIAHAMLGHGSNDCILDTATKELQAEATAFIVSHFFGVDTSEYSFEYLASWGIGKPDDALQNQMAVIQKVADQIISKIEDILPKKEIDLNAELFDEHCKKIGVFQLTRGDANHDRRFMSIEYLKENGLSVDSERYDLVGVIDYEDTKSLEDYYIEMQDMGTFGIKGHSLSVSDVLVINDDGKITSSYVDSFGYATITGFTGDDRELHIIDNAEILQTLSQNGMEDVTRDEVSALTNILDVHGIQLGICGGTLVEVDVSAPLYEVKDCSVEKCVERGVMLAQSRYDDAAKNPNTSTQFLQEVETAIDKLSSFEEKISSHGRHI